MTADKETKYAKFVNGHVNVPNQSPEQFGGAGTPLTPLAVMLPAANIAVIFTTKKRNTEYPRMNWTFVCRGITLHLLVPSSLRESNQLLSKTIFQSISDKFPRT